jgi:predicted enzyme related to lactoylglutathione lyase
MAHGDYNHIEIPADDPARAQGFYEGLFGWQFTAMPGYEDYSLYLTQAGREGVGGAIGKRDVSAGHAVRNYISVDSLDDSVAKAESLGGRVVAAREEVPTQGWFAVLADTEGNEFALWEQMKS